MLLYCQSYQIFHGEEKSCYNFALLKEGFYEEKIPKGALSNRKAPWAGHFRTTTQFILENQMYNLRQKVEDKFTKLSKIGFSTECFTADFLQFFTKKRQNLAFGLTAGYSPSNPRILGIFLKFPNFLRSPKSFFFLVWAWKPAQRRKCRGHIFSVKMSIIR